MDFFIAQRLINKNVLDVASSINKLHPVQIAKKTSYIRMKESSFVLTEDIARYREVVTAHDLHQYKNKFHSIYLKEDLKSWLDILVENDKEEFKCY